MNKHDSKPKQHIIDNKINNKNKINKNIKYNNYVYNKEKFNILIIKKIKNILHYK
jgi:hypothetical protein